MFITLSIIQTYNMEKKIYNIVSQDIETVQEACFLEAVIRLAKEAGYTHIHDHWGVKAWDELTIDEAIEKFIVKYPESTEINDELPF